MAKTFIALAALLAVLACAPLPGGAQVESATPSRVQAPPEADPNAFNRLFKPAGERNLPPTEDGIHDPASAGTPMLQAPSTAFRPLPKSSSGNNVNWVGAAESGKIRPRWSAKDQAARPQVLDLNIVREVKGSMPDVLFPHKKHTDQLDCGDCHPAVFAMQKGASKMSMTAIMLGESCGACHGRVAFPVTECRLCHSVAKAGNGSSPTQAKGNVKR